jgi:S1-C subfamily serine protease
LKKSYAVEVVSVETNGPAGRAGLRQGDLIVAVNGEAVQSVDDLHRFLSDWPIGRSAEVEILRGMARQTLGIVPREALA